MTISPSSIPEAAVEAAIQASYRRNDWGDEYNRKFIKRALEAAAPHMLADAWDEGADFVNEGVQSFAMDNPYRK